MIIQLLIMLIFSLLNIILDLINLPGMPTPILQASSAIYDFFHIPLGLIRLIIGDTFLASISVALLAYYLFIPGFHITQWLYHKFRG